MENYRRLFYSPSDVRIRPGESFSFDFDADPATDAAYRFFYTGEVDNCFFWKTEYCCPFVYKRIDDSLVEGSITSRALKFSGADHPVQAFRKIMFPPSMSYVCPPYGDDWNVGVSVSGRD
ncbi:MAG: hypothetical protein IJV00_10785, partial [Clostridia bacterium]|nr:hypothetical protein [Clostridia bacterium]